MIVFRNNVVTTFKVACKSSYTALNDVILRFSRINGDDTEYDFDAVIVEYDCFNRLLELSTTINLDTGEYKMYIVSIGAYSLDYSEDYERIDDSVSTIAVDNANIKRENIITEDSSGVASIE